jgi:hypothetical protein
MDRKERNNIAKSIVNSHNREEVKKILNSAVHQGVVFTSGDFSVPSVSANIGNCWLNHNELWDAFTRTKYSKFFYTEAVEGDAHSWTKKGTDPKEIQELELEPREITTSYQYKRQQITQEDLDDLRDSGEYDEFLDWTTWELRRNVEDYIIGTILGTYNPVPASFKYELLYQENSPFVGNWGWSTDIADLQTMCAGVDKRGSKWLILSPETYNTILNDSGLITEYNLMSNLGVDYIYQTWLCNPNLIVCMDPSQYAVKIKNELSVAYPFYQGNAINFQYEINGGGLIKSPGACSFMLNENP